MLNLIHRVLGRNRLSYSCPIRFSPFSSEAPRSISETANKNFLIANYLKNTFGFSEERAFAASKYLKIDSSEKPESVIAFLKTRGFTSDQIGSIVRNFPLIAGYDPHKTFIPKIDFFEYSGISRTEVNNIILTAPGIFSRSLENHIMPSFNYIKSFLYINGSSVSFTKMRFAKVLCCDFESELIPNIVILREAGVPDSRIATLLQNNPRTLMVETEKFSEVVNEVKQMKFSPSGAMFTLAVRAIRSMSKSTWENKVAVYKKWGLSDNDIISAFKRYPYCMMLSTDKITEVMDFLVNEMGLDSSFMVKRPNVICLSLEKRIEPRCAVYKILVENGLVENASFLISIFVIAERDFLKKFVQRYEKEVPGLLECYQKSLDVSKS